MCNDLYPVLGILQVSFTALNVFCAPPNFPSPPQSLAISDLFIVSIVLPFPECHIIGIVWYVAFSDHLALCISGSPVSFCGLIAHFFLALNDILLYGVP